MKHSGQEIICGNATLSIIKACTQSMKRLHGHPEPPCGDGIFVGHLQTALIPRQLATHTYNCAHAGDNQAHVSVAGNLRGRQSTAFLFITSSIKVDLPFSAAVPIILPKAALLIKSSQKVKVLTGIWTPPHLLASQRCSWLQKWTSKELANLAVH